MFKILFSVGVLSIPSVFSFVGAVPGVLLLLGFGAFNTYAAFLLGEFRFRHPGIHVSHLSCHYRVAIKSHQQGLQDMAFVVGGKWYRELVGILFIIG